MAYMAIWKLVSIVFKFENGANILNFAQQPVYH